MPTPTLKPEQAAAFNTLLDQALEQLERLDPRLVQVVEMRYFAGMTEPEIAAALGLSDRTVRRSWEKARLLLAALLD